ncbi:40S ribosomal s13 protein [Rutstroemia sp. NJR-2017a BBW]|nr:40S ribosomal s13 protein [Rutstroemia sp. NJR-2017a BBW]
MVLILGINFPERNLIKLQTVRGSGSIGQRTDIWQKSLETFYGLGHQTSSRLLAKLYIHPTATVGSLSNKTQLAIGAELSKLTIESALRRKIQENIMRLRDMGTYRGRRHAMGLPVRGQKTRTQITTARKLNKVMRKG